jgi:hypothetical protein
MNFMDHGLITQDSRDLYARFPERSRIMNIFCKEKHVDSVHGLSTTSGVLGPPWLVVARTRGRRATVARSLELILRLLRGIGAHW